jgi:hypothetical protein
MKQAIAEVVCRPLSQAKSENSVLTLRSLFNELDLRNQEINAAVRANLDCE